MKINSFGLRGPICQHAHTHTLTHPETHKLAASWIYYWRIKLAFSANTKEFFNQQMVHKLIQNVCFINNGHQWLYWHLRLEWKELRSFGFTICSSHTCAPSCPAYCAPPTVERDDKCSRSIVLLGNYMETWGHNSQQVGWHEVKAKLVPLWQILQREIQVL